MQTGFRSERSIQDHIISIKQTAYKPVQGEENVFLAFEDMEKAFNKEEDMENPKERNIQKYYPFKQN